VSPHERDPLSLMLGLLVLLVGGGFLVGDLTSLTVSAAWAGPVVLLGIGGAGLLASLRSGRRES
jgi:hypothetical protein